MNWFWERRRGFAVLGAAAVGTYYAGKFAVKKFFEIQDASAKTKFAQDKSVAHSL